MKKSYILSHLLFVALFFSLAARATVPTVTTNPRNDTVCTGSLARFFVAAVDTPGSLPMRYSWEVSANGGATWDSVRDTTFYAGAGTDTLKVTSSVMLGGYLYRAIVSNSDGNDTSLDGMLTVETLYAGAITGPSAVCVGSTISLSSSVSGGTWTSASPSLATVGSASGVVTGVATGYATILYAVTNLCGTDTTTTTRHVDTVVTALPISGPSMTCVSHFITLTNPNVIGTGLWSSSAPSVAVVSSAGSVTGVAYGTTTIDYNFTNACNSVSSFFTVGVDTPLAAGVVSGPTKLCAGSFIHLTASVPGGTWFSGSSAIAVVDASGNVTGVSSGVVTISYYLTNACGASVATHVDTVERTASMIVGLDSVGIGLTRTYTDSALGGSWSMNIADTGILTIDSTGVVTGVGAGIADITYTVTNVCGTSTAVLPVHVGPAPSVPAIGGLDSVCVGTVITLTNSLTGGKWHIAPDTLASIDSVSGAVSGLMYGHTTASYSFTNGFGTTTISKAVFVNDVPNVSVTGPAVIALGTAYQIRGVPYGIGYSSAVWTQSNTHTGFFVSFDDSVHIVSYAYFYVQHGGRDTLTYTVHNSCGTRSAYMVVTLDPTSVHTVSKTDASLQAYPNPSNGEFTVSLSSATDEAAVITITNILGEKVKELTISTNKSYDVKLEQPTGIYFLTATTADSRYSGQITITR